MQPVDMIEFLKKYFWKNGFDKLSENPFDVYKVMVKSNKGKQVIGYTYPVQSLEGDICYVYSCNLFDQRPLFWT